MPQQRKIRIGVLSEGNSDLSVIEILVRRILENEDLELEFSCWRARTMVVNFVKPYLRLFFEREAPVDFGLFVTDNDSSSDSRRKKIYEIVDGHNAGVYRERVAVGVPQPHMEAWLIADQDTVKHTFNLPAADPLPMGNSPKEMLLSLVGNQTGTGTLSQSDAYAALARSADLGLIKTRCRDFRTFCEDLIPKIRAI
jgi:hypothetical protein